MGFMKEQFEAVKQSVQDGQPQRAAESVVCALLEGPGTFDENLTSLTRAAVESNRRQG